MKLKFLGRGSAFNVKEGNTSAYFIEEDTLFLIDCGETVFTRLVQKKVLDNIKTINVLITHLHPDNVGSLGTLIFYSYFVMKKPINILISDNIDYLIDLRAYLFAVGCTKEMYDFVDVKSLDNSYTSFDTIRFFSIKHTPEIPSHCIVFCKSGNVTVYSGDTNDFMGISCVLFYGDSLETLYVDTTSANYPGNVHLYIGDLALIIPENMRSKVYCMHFNNDECIKIAKEYGFNVVEVE